MKHFFRNIAVFLLISIISSCASIEPYFKISSDKTFASNDSKEIDSEVFLVGDIGTSSNLSDQDDVVSLIKHQLDPSRDNQTVVFLGNSIDKNGLPDEHQASRQDVIASMKKCMQELKSATDRVYFIPGSYEWNNGKRYTVEALEETEKFMESLGGKKMLYPHNGCGEPKVIELTDDLILVLIDSQWLIQGDRSKERSKSGCDVDNTAEFMTALQDVLKSHRRKNVVIAAHHPIYSNGRVAGNYSIKNHLLPLPVLGSLITGMRKLGVSQQKMSHPQYEAYRSSIQTVLNNFKGVTYVSSHENNLQHKADGENNYIIAGSGSQVEYVRQGGAMDFSYMNKGFAKIVHYKNLEMWLEFIVPEEGNPTGKVVYRKLLHKKLPPEIKPQEYHAADKDCPPTVKKQASTLYDLNSKLFFGEHYRKAWSAEIEVKTLLIDLEHGGLKPVQEGGGFQTKSLRLENENGEQFVLRTIDKDVSLIVPPALQNSFAAAIVQDGISSSHPYGFLAVPGLAEAAGIYHTNPQVVFVPGQKALGEYNDDYANKMYLYEERVGGNTSKVNSFGNTPKTISSLDLIDKLQKSAKHKIDGEWAMRSRLFDIIIGDWDRHEDQWRWATFKKDGKTLYRPIPRDRDQAFFFNDGLIHKLGTHPYFNPQLRIYKHEPDNLGGLTFNARYFDRTFLNQVTREQMVQIAKELQERLTDEVIKEAFTAWPKEIRELDEAIIIDKIKYRRDNLIRFANEYSDLLESTIYVHGTDDKDEFILTALENNKLDVKVYRVEKGEKELLFSRVVNGEKTKELQLYGLTDKDKFSYEGEFKNKVKVRIIGGGGSDKIQNTSVNKMIVYDTPKGIEQTGDNLKDKTSNKRGINTYNRRDWNLNRSFHFPMPTFYTDEGIGVSYNALFKNFGFRKKPFKEEHQLTAAYFTRNSAFLFSYDGVFKQLIGNWDFKVEALFTGPTFTQYYYGLGNKYIDYEEVFPTIEEAENNTFHIVKGTTLDINPKFILPMKNGQEFSINPSYEYFDLESSNDEDRFYLLPEANIPKEEFDVKHYVALGVNYNSTRLDNTVVPRRGFVIDVGTDYKLNTQETEFSNITFSSNIATYIPFNQRKTIVLAMNMGGSHTEGEIELFHYNYLSNMSRLRGFRTNRFSGQSIAYHATDLRVGVFEKKGTVPLRLGVFGAFDYGRAWFDGDSGTGSSDWHTSVGGGIYITPLDLFGFKFGYYQGEDDSQIIIGGGLTF